MWICTSNGFTRQINMYRGFSKGNGSRAEYVVEHVDMFIYSPIIFTFWGMKRLLTREMWGEFHSREETPCKAIECQQFQLFPSKAGLLCYAKK